MSYFDNLAFDVGSKVKIRANDEVATVRYIRWDGHELDYFVTWWDDQTRKEYWLRVDELEAVSGTAKVNA